MIGNLTLRPARPDDLALVDALMARSFTRLLRRDYPPSLMVTVVPRIARARPDLLASRRYFVVEGGEGRLVGAGGYSLGQGSVEAEVRQLASDPDFVRQGIGRRLMEGIVAATRAEGVRALDCLATLTAAPFYAAMGFRSLGRVEVPMLPGLSFPVIKMRCDI